MKPDYDAAVAFLARFAPDGPWTLTSIEPDRKGIETRTFRVAEELGPWLDEHGSSRNIYYAVNPLIGPVAKKARREDVAALSWLHVDLDPRAGEELEAERGRILGLLQAPPEGVPPPTAIVYSGGGYNGLWRLADPVPIRGDLELAEAAKLYNLQLEILLGADACHNVDRIMRLPGTLNRPNARKRKAGRKIELARVVEFRDHVYPISAFTAAPPLQEGSDNREVATVPTNVERLRSVDDLGDDVPDWCKVLIVQGEDPTDPTRHQSRSEALWAVCCELARRGIAHETIFAVVTDPDFGISSSVLDKGPRADTYAWRQIQRAGEEAEDPRLREMNDRYAVIGDYGGRCVVLSETYDHALDRPKLSRQAFADFEKRYLNKRVRVGTKGDGDTPVFVPMGKWWLNHERRRQYDALIFAPNRDVEGVYNLWRGFACEARPGDCGRLLTHVRENVCRGDVEHYNYLMGWMANAVQYPGRPGYSAVVLRGARGTGKTFFAQAFGSLWGRHFMQVSDPKFLVGSFNQHLRDCVVLFGDEAFYAGDRKHESVLKNLITSDVLTIEAKYADAETAANYVHLMMASNEDWVIPAGLRERRFFVLDVGDEHARDHAYFGAMQSELDTGGREAFLHLLLTHDLQRFDVRDVPATDALRDQQCLSMGGLYEWWYAKLAAGAVLETDDGWEREVPVSSLGYDLRMYLQGFGRERATLTKLGLFLEKVLPDGWPKTTRLRTPMEVRTTDGALQLIERPRVYQIPGLAQCRHHWNTKIDVGGRWRVDDIAQEGGEDTEF